ncbi:MAG: PAS domain S-box protein [Gammaproteobacteria bacterium]|nr:PAS domain S-box protein [Gammaproteobacteria bacterium]
MLIVFAALLPTIGALIVSIWITGKYNWSDFLLELGTASLILSLIIYPIYLLIQFDERKAIQWNKNKQDFRMLIDQVVDMVLLVRYDGTIIDANQQACTKLGYSKEEFAQLSILDIDLECYLHRNPALVDELKLGNNVIYDTFYMSKAGKRIPVESRAKQVNWLDEPHYIEFSTDISHRLAIAEKIDESREMLERTRNTLEQRVAEHTSELRKQMQNREMAERHAVSIQHYLENLIDSMPSAIIAINQSNRIMQWNQEAEHLSGITAKDAHGNLLSEIMPELDEFIADEKRKRSHLSSKFAFQFKLLSHGEKRSFEVMIYPIITLEEEHSGQVIRIDDITEKLKIIEALTQSEKMLSLGGLAAGMAHEINNPLGAIVQSTQNIKRRLFGDLPRNTDISQSLQLEKDKLHSYLEQQNINDFLDGILLSGERAASIITDMLNFARPIKDLKTELSVTEALDTAIRLSEKDYNQKKQYDFRKIKINKTYSPNTHKIMAHKNQLEQVFLNLLTNAAQALGQIREENFKPTIDLMVHQESNAVRIDVIDNGPGMPEATRKRVFEPFFTTKDEKTGTGLGLSVSYFIVCEQLGGKMSVESTPNKGTKFIIHLPLPEKHRNEDDKPGNQFALPI